MNDLKISTGKEWSIVKTSIQNELASTEKKLHVLLQKEGEPSTWEQSNISDLVYKRQILLDFLRQLD